MFYAGLCPETRILLCIYICVRQVGSSFNLHVVKLSEKVKLKRRTDRVAQQP